MMGEEYDIGLNAAVEHLKRKHDDWVEMPLHCGLGGFECPLCGWMVTVDVVAGKSDND